MKWSKSVAIVLLFFLMASCNNQREGDGVASTLPVADFSANRSEVPPGTVINFRSLSENATSHTWIFQGGIPSTSIEENPSVRFDRLGSYTITLTVGNNEGEDEEVKNNFITVANDEVEQ